MCETPENMLEINIDIKEKMKHIKDRETTAGNRQKDFIEIIKEAAENHVMQKADNRKKEYISEETYRRITN